MARCILNEEPKTFEISPNYLAAKPLETAILNKYGWYLKRICLTGLGNRCSNLWLAARWHHAITSNARYHHTNLISKIIPKRYSWNCLLGFKFIMPQEQITNRNPRWLWNKPATIPRPTEGVWIVGILTVSSYAMLAKIFRCNMSNFVDDIMQEKLL